MAREPISRTNKLIALAAVAGLVFLFALPSLFGVPASGPVVAHCGAAKQQLADAVAIDPAQVRNPRPGVMLMPPLYWGALDHAERRNLVDALATQKGCETGSDPAGADVEVRSSRDNRLLGSGRPANFEETN